MCVACYELAVYNAMEMNVPLGKRKEWVRREQDKIEKERHAQRW